MNSFLEDILFFDLEVNPKTKVIEDIGAIYLDSEFHSAKIYDFEKFSQNPNIICGHNIVFHDLKYLKSNNFYAQFFEKMSIDTLFFSALIFPEKPYHHLVKDYRLNKTELNNPLSDSKIARILFYDLFEKYSQLKKKFKIIYFNLLKDIKGFSGFFEIFKEEIISSTQLNKLINSAFKNKLCIDISKFYLIENNPIELAYALATISTDDSESITPPWIMNNFPEVTKIINYLRFIKCSNDQCSYCINKLDIKRALYNYFGYKDFRRFDTDDQIPLQEIVVNAGIK